MKWKNVRVLGRGGFGVVTLAKNSDGHQVAVKRMRAGWDESAWHRFVREVQEISALDHPNIVRILHAELNAVEPFYVMKFYEDGSLRDKLNLLRAQNKVLTAAAAASISRLLAEALHYAHSQGIWHRDLKPENVMFDGEIPVICDWGLGKFLHRQSVMLTHAGNLGTARYCSPEQWRTGGGDHRSDIYSLGMILMEMTTATVERSAGLPLVPVEIRALVTEMLSDDPDARPASMGDVVDRLSNVPGVGGSGNADEFWKAVGALGGVAMVGLAALAIAKALSK